MGEEVRGVQIRSMEQLKLPLLHIYSSMFFFLLFFFFLLLKGLDVSQVWEFLSLASPAWHHLVKNQVYRLCLGPSGGGAWWDMTSPCGLTSLLAEVFHGGPAACADIIRGGAVNIRECVGYWPVMSIELCIETRRSFLCMSSGTSIPVVVIVLCESLHLTRELHINKWGRKRFSLSVAVLWMRNPTALRTLAHLRLLQLQGRKTQSIRSVWPKQMAH